MPSLKQVFLVDGALTLPHFAPLPNLVSELPRFQYLFKMVFIYSSRPFTAPFASLDGLPLPPVSLTESSQRRSKAISPRCLICEELGLPLIFRRNSQSLMTLGVWESGAGHKRQDEDVSVAPFSVRGLVFFWGHFKGKPRATRQYHEDSRF